MNWPQITLIILLAFGLGVTAIKHGEPRNDKYSFWWQLAGNLVIAWLLWCGGFFSQARAAQPPQAALQYRDDVIRNARLEWGMSAPVADFAAQLHQESGWRPDAVSPVGAQGLAQFMPATADWISQLMPGLNSREPFNPAWAIRALVSYDRWLWQRVSAATRTPLATAFKTLLDSTDPVLNFSEHATKDRVSTDIKTTSAEFAEADPERLALHQKALELSKKEGISYDAAVSRCL